MASASLRYIFKPAGLPSDATLARWNGVNALTSLWTKQIRKILRLIVLSSRLLYPTHGPRYSYGHLH